MIRLQITALICLLGASFGHAQTWNLVWSDEFDVNGAVDASKWHHQTQLLFPGCCWANGELQHYTDRIDNSSVSGGTLKIEAKKETYNDQGVTKQYTSARLNSKFAFQYGRVVVRAKLPTGGGTWPAIWMLGKNINEDGGYWDNQGFGTTPWPDCGEIDIMEHWGWNQNYISSAMHTPSSSGGTVNVGGQVIPTATSAFHDYEMIWTADSIWFAVDGVHHYTYNPAVKDASTWPFDAEQYLLLNLAIENSVDPAFMSGIMEIDHVRVYEAEAPAVTFRVDVSDLTLAPTDVVYWNSEKNGWCGSCAPMTNIGNDVWEIVVDEGYAPGPWEYKFTINAWSIQETLDPSADAACTVTDGGFTNRVVNVGFADLDVGTVCWEACDASCSTTSGPDVPSVPAPDPTEDPADVISMFSDAYTDVPVDTWRTPWSAGELTDTSIVSNPTKKYWNLDFVGIETVNNQIDISAMDTFHVDIWTPNMTTFRVKLVDFGPNGIFQGGDDSEHEVTITPLSQNSWLSLAIPMTDFTGLTGRNNFAQLIFSGLPVGAGTVFIDNVYFSQAGTINPPGNEPSVAAPNPTQLPSNVISMFSDVYADVPVDTWQTVWSAAVLTDTSVNGNLTKRYDNLDFVGVETVSNQIDISAMDTFHFDAWTPNMTQIRVKLVDFGPNGSYDAGGVDDSEHELTFENPAQNGWIEYDLPLSSFSGLSNTTNIAQLIFSGQPAGGGILFIDNVYFSKEAEPTLEMKAFLQGPMDFNSGTMNDDLRVAGLVPSADPYPALGFSYDGAGWPDSFDPVVLNATGNEAIVDWVIVDMYPDATVGGNTATRYSRPALIQRDGDIVNLDGTSPLNLSMPAGTYFSSVRHRNHLGVITANSSLFGAGNVSIDFAQNSGVAVGAEAMYISGPTRAMWSGDVTFDGIIKYTGSDNDRDPVLVEVGGSVPTATANNVYSSADVNMDGVVKYTGSDNDRDPILVNVGGSVPTNTRQEVGF